MTVVNRSAPSVLISYAHEDRNLANELRQYLNFLQRRCEITLLDDHRISKLEKSQRELDLKRANLLILLLTPEFLQSGQLMDELRAASEANESGATAIMPILADACNLSLLPELHRAELLPKDDANCLRPLSNWGSSRGKALADIAGAIRKVLEDQAWANKEVEVPSAVQLKLKSPKSVSTPEIDPHSNETTEHAMDVKVPLRLEEVFKRGGVPTHTFVEPEEFPRLIIALRTPGRGIVVEGPSGIGKATAIEHALRSIGVTESALKLSARKPNDLEIIDALPSIADAGTVIIDDFHRLPQSSKAKISDYLKSLADEENSKTKLILIGINNACRSLIDIAPDLVNRVEIIRFEINPDYKIAELIGKGQSALNVRMPFNDDLLNSARGSFFLTQLLCAEACLKANILEEQRKGIELPVSFEAVKASVHKSLAVRFQKRTIDFCRGTKFNREGRAPYLHILHWVATSKVWSVRLDDEVRKNKEFRGSVGQVVEKGFLKDLIEKNVDIHEVLHFDPETTHLTIEDPQYLFFLSNLSWATFAEQVGFKKIRFEGRYDFALSFAGADRDVAESLYNALRERDFEVFYDRAEQYRMLAADIEEYLEPIYQSEASLVVCVLGPEYPTRVWTKVESDAFRNRLGTGCVICLCVDEFRPSTFNGDSRRAYGCVRREHLSLDIDKFAEMLCKKCSEM